MNKKLNPLQMVAREMAGNSDLDSGMIEESLSDLLEHLNRRALKEIDEDPESDEAMAAAVQYRVACEVVAVFGTQLIAFGDMDNELVPEGESN